MYFFSLLLNNDYMKTTFEIHKENLEALVEEFNSVAAVAKMIGCSDSQYSQWLHSSTNSGTGKPRGMRPSSARRIEKACGKPAGWMDREHPKVEAKSNAEPPARMFYFWVSADEAELVTNLRTSDSVGQGLIIDVARGTKKIITPATTENQG